MTVTANKVHEFWFGTLNAHGLADKSTSARWWKKDEDFDSEIRERFGATLEAAHRGELVHWMDTPSDAAALVVLCDQFPRNMYRGTARMFASDGLALTTTLRCLPKIHEMRAHESVFTAMPMMHSESLEIQTLGKATFEAIRDQVATPEAQEAVAGNVGFADKHLVIVERFGRFPHRNATLDRTSTDEERAFLETPGSSF